MVTDFYSIDPSLANHVLQITAALEAHSNHPVASAIVKHAREAGVLDETLIINDFQSITGHGLQGDISGTYYYIGSPAFFRKRGPKTIPRDIDHKTNELQAQGKTVMMIGTSEKILAILAVTDTVRQKSRSVIQRLKELGISETVMLTGDNHADS